MAFKDKEKAAAYKKKYYEENKDRIWNYNVRKDSVLKWRKNNKTKIAKYARDTYDPEKAKTSWDKHKRKWNAIGREETKNLSESYIIKQLKKNGYTADQIKQCPELIDTHRIIIKTKRLWKTSKNSGKA